jgi:hypothetical protein
MMVHRGLLEGPNDLMRPDTVGDARIIPPTLDSGVLNAKVA